MSKLSGMRVRLQLTLLYGLLSFLSGIVLLGITYVLVGQGVPTVVTSQRSQTVTGEQQTTTTTTSIAGGNLPARTLPPGTTRAEAERVAQAARREAEQQRDGIMHLLLMQSVLALAIMTVFAAVLGWWMAGRALRPVRTMTTSIQRISARNVHERLAVAGPPDELKSLADTVDGLLGRLEGALDSHKRFVANAAHELRTPLTLEHALLEETVIDPDATVDSFRQQFKQLMAVSEQQARLLESLLVLATSERGPDRRESADLAAIAQAAVPVRAEVTVVTDLRPAPVTGDPALLERMVANLVDNALSYNLPEGRVEIATGTEGGRPFLSVANTGPPVPPEMVDKLLHPFQRLDRTADDGHHGLGLSIVQSIAAAHEADLTVAARREGGLLVRVLFSVPVV